MKTKSIFLALLFLFFASLACNNQTTPTNNNATTVPPTINPVDAQATRQSLITDKADLFTKDYSWQIAPKSCTSSMAKIWLHSPNNQEVSEIASSSVVSSNIFIDQWGNKVFVYWLLIANHSFAPKPGENLNGLVQLSPNKSDTYLEYDFLGYKQIVDSSGNALDLGILAISTKNEQLSLENFNVIPLNTENVASAYEIESNNGKYYYSFDYPNGNLPQFTVFTLYKPGETTTGEPIYIAEIVEGSSTISIGSSGGAICDESGRHIGVVARYAENWNTSFRITPNPTNIHEQLDLFTAESSSTLSSNGFTKTP